MLRAVAGGWVRNGHGSPGGSFNIRTTLFPLGTEAGLWYDASDLAAGYQDSAGTTALYAPGVGSIDPPVGAIIDKRKGSTTVAGAGNHSYQATAASRPLESARLNQLVATATLSTQSATVAATAQTLSFTGTGTVTLSGVSVAGPLVGTGVNNRVSLTFTPTAGALTLTVTGSVTLAQLEVGSAFTAYQSVVDANNYNTSGFPLFEKFDGIDDGYGTATNAAGFLSNNMDAFFVMKRSSAAKFIVNFETDGGVVYFAAANAAGGAAPSSAGSGTPTFLVNGVSVPGGTTTTAVQLDAAVTVGAWVVLEVRNLNLSLWTAFRSANYVTGSWMFAGNIQQIVLCPAQTDAVRATTRTNLGKAVGLVI